MLEYLKKVLQDERNEPSSKRVIAFIGSSILFLGFVYSLATGYQADASLVTGVVTVIGICLGATSLDKYTKNIEL